MINMWLRRLRARLLTKAQFERRYAKGSATTVAKLHEWGREGCPCDCGDASCNGWQMIHRDA